LQFSLQAVSPETFGYTLVVTQLVKKFPTLTEDSLPCFQEATSDLYPEPDEATFPQYFPKIHYNIIFPSTPYSLE